LSLLNIGRQHITFLTVISAVACHGFGLYWLVMRTNVYRTGFRLNGDAMASGLFVHLSDAVMRRKSL